MRPFANSQTGMACSYRTKPLSRKVNLTNSVSVQVARRSGLDLAQFVRVYRHQTPIDPRPNKDLFELAFCMVLYPHGNQTGQPGSSRVLQTIKFLPSMASKYETTSLKATKKDIISS
ncbi:LOW QUALITY PROTEIN: hypothetical protein PHMEG_00017256 [Phytophthora megakarya]|uniref:Uncharacterized protein n=1 Tax=Phytophthora megakarya TaxID=4795 RepID=A0A225VXU8_9STRA|nr:LOW QUALITY PROTEIN: hypothetical protein PHMEG_00017256 [Phytophthora megakarya]